MIGAHNRQIPEARSASAAETIRVTAALTGAAAAGVPRGTVVSMSKRIGMTVAAIRAITVPATTGVMMRRSMESLAASANWNTAEMTIRVASRPGPPSTSAATQTAMKAPEVPMMRMWPAPNRPTRTACRIVLRPLMTSAAKTAQFK